MPALRAKLNRLEAMLPGAAAERQASRAHLQMVTQVALAQKPDLELVEPQDTDERTYAEILADRLTAAGRHDEAEALWARYAEPDPEPPPEVHDIPAGHLAWWMREVFKPRAEDSWRREEAAIQRAKARIAGNRRGRRPVTGTRRRTAAGSR